MTFTLTIRTDNAAFEDDPGELRRLIEDVAAQDPPSTEPHHAVSVLDVNGNRVGQWKVTDE